MLLSYNADLLPRVRMLGRINYTEPWIHFSRTIDEYVLYVIRDGNMYLQEDGIFYHLKAGDFFLLEPGLCHEGYQRAACNYYYAHFTHPEMARVEDEDAAMSLLAEKRRLSLVSYNLDEADPTDPITYLPKQFHLPGSEFNTILRTALDCYNAREEHYKRRTAALLHSFFLEVAHEHLLARGVFMGFRRLFDLRPAAIIKKFSLTEPPFRYADLASYGHFGRPDVDCPWERLDQVEKIKELLQNG